MRVGCAGAARAGADQPRHHRGLDGPLRGGTALHLEHGRALALRSGGRFLNSAAWRTRRRSRVSGRRMSLAAVRSVQAIELARRHGWTDEPAAGIAYAVPRHRADLRGRLDEAERGSSAPSALSGRRPSQRGLLVCYGRGLLELARAHYTDAPGRLPGRRAAGRLLAAPQLLLRRVQALRLQANGAPRRGRSAPSVPSLSSSNKSANAARYVLPRAVAAATRITRARRSTRSARSSTVLLP